MIVVSMRPARRINLSGRNTYRSQSSHGKSTLLAASSVCRTDRGKRSRSTTVGRLIGYPLMTPMVDFQNSIFHAHPLHTLFQFLKEYHSGIIQIFIVYTDRKHKVTEQQLRYVLAPSHFLPCLKARTYIFQEETCRIVSHVSHWHVGIEELQGLLLLSRQFLLSDHSRLFSPLFFQDCIIDVQAFHLIELPAHEFHLALESVFHLRAISSV